MIKKDNLEELAGKYTLLRRVIDGDTTLEERLEDYEKELYSNFDGDRWWSRYITMIGGGVSDSDDFSDYDTKMKEFIQIIEEAGGKRLGLSQPIAPGYTAIPCALGYACSRSRLDHSKDRESLEKGKEYVRRTKEFFSYLRTKVQEIDSTICQIYCVKYFMQKPEHFKNVYKKMDKKEQMEVQKKLGGLVELGALDMSVTDLEKFLNKLRD